MSGPAYVVHRQLGSGFFGEVWLVDDTATGRRCALKLLNAARLGRPIAEVHAEAQALVEAEHDHVVHVYSAGMLGKNQPYIAMEYLRRGSLADQFGKEPGPVREVMIALIEGCRGVQAAHENGLLHRDLKPGNFLIDDGRRVKVSDFGLACRQAAPYGGSFRYTRHLPPEDHAAGLITTVQGDVYSLGMTLYRLLNGDGHLDATLRPGEQILDAIAAGRYPDRKRWLPHVPRPVRRAVNAALNPDPASRTDSAWKLRHALERSLPIVSWNPDVSGREWNGTTVDGSRVWRVEVVGTKTGHELRVASGPAGGRLRRRGDPVEFATLKAATVVAEKVLNRIGTTGE